MDVKYTFLSPRFRHDAPHPDDVRRCSHWWHEEPMGRRRVVVLVDDDGAVKESVDGYRLIVPARGRYAPVLAVEDAVALASEAGYGERLVYRKGSLEQAAVLVKEKK